jgi:Gas vesicle synthesis protein GvpL/GvpF
MTSTRSPVNATAAKRAVPDPPGEPELAYVYGIAPSSPVIPPGLTGVGEPAGDVKLLRHQRIAAITSAIPAELAPGTPADLRAHANVLGAFSALVPVLPMRFGGILADHHAVVAELLEPYHDEFAFCLDRLAGHDQFTIKGRYLGETALREVLLAEPEAMRLLGMLRGTEAAAFCHQRIRLGEMVARGLDRRRAADRDTLIEMLAPHATDVALRAPAESEGAVHASFLVPRTRRLEFERAAEELGKHWDGRIRLRFLGPLAPYDFAEPWPTGD